MTVCILSSSPRKEGNTDLMCDQFAKGAIAAGHEVVKIRLAEKKIGYCKGCYVCKQTKQCVQQDDARGIIDQMLEADVIVFATPVYFYSISAQLKTLIDRTVVVYPSFQKKKFYYLLAMEDTDIGMLTGTLETLRGFLACCEGAQELGYTVAAGASQKGVVKTLPVWETVYQAGRTL